MTSIKCITLLSLLMSSVAQAGMFRWVDEHGKVHYGDRVPPAYSQSGHTKLNKHGLTEAKVASAKERKQKLAALAQEKARQEKLKIEKHKADLQEMRDTQLLSMYSSLEELETVYQSKLEMADGSILILQARHKKLSERLEKLEGRHERLVNPNHKNKLGMRISDILDNLQIYQQAITENQVERQKIKERFRYDLARFVAITASKEKAEPSGKF